MIYVDQLFEWGVYREGDKLADQAKRVGTRHGHRWCHLWCDKGEEEQLHALARKIGMRRSWFQNKIGFPHYDLVPPKRAKAIALGAVEMSLVEWRRQGLADMHGAAASDSGEARVIGTEQIRLPIECEGDEYYH